MKRTYAFIFIACIILASCINTPSTVKQEEFTVQYTSASIPWLANLQNCAGTNVIATEQRAADFLDPKSANMVIRIGRPDNLDAYAYQIGTEDILVIVNAKNPTTTLTSEEVFELFSGQIQNWKVINGNDAPVQVWVYLDGEDIQELFNQTVLEGSPVSSEAHLAVDADQMVQAVGKDDAAIGIITRRLKAGNISEVYTAVKSIPVLAITLVKAQGALSQILACLQK